MDRPTFPDFDGWSVGYVGARRELRAIKHLDDGTRLSVRGFGADLDRVYLSIRRDAYAEEARVGLPGAEDRFAAADKDIVRAKVRNALAKGTYDRAGAVQRMTEAGFTFAEMAETLGED